MQNANLIAANLHKTNFTEANLIETNFQYSNFDQAILKNADLEYADLRNAKNLKIPQLKSAINWDRAIYDRKIRIQLGITDDQLVSILPEFNKAHNKYLSSGFQKAGLNELMKYYGLDKKEEKPKPEPASIPQ